MRRATRSPWRNARRSTYASVSIAIAWLLDSAGCTTSAAATDAGGADADASDLVECVPDSWLYPLDTYEPNLQKTGQNGALTFELVSSDPAPPEVGYDKFLVRVTHADGTPFQGSLVIPYQGVWMPLHGHGANIPAVVTFDAAQNAFTLYPMDIYMTGMWRITLQAFEAGDAGAPDDDAAVPAPAQPTDVAVFYFCI